MKSLKVNFWLTLLLVASAITSVPLAHAVDLDGNGMDDETEIELAEKFKPGFILHKDRYVEPEPVEIMSIDSDSNLLDILDVRVRVTTVATGDAWDGLLSDYDPSMASSDYPVSNLNSGLSGGENFYYHWEYGYPGEEGLGEGWEETYLNGRGGTLPGSHYPPTVYPHVYYSSNDSRWVIQYWIFYPFNFAPNRHEGDWEHINVGISTGDPGNAEIDYVEYFMHKRRYRIEGSSLDQMHYSQGCHPIIRYDP